MARDKEIRLKLTNFMHNAVHGIALTYEMPITRVVEQMVTAFLDNDSMMRALFPRALPKEEVKEETKQVKEEKAAKVSMRDAVSNVRVMISRINKLTHSNYKALELLDTGTGFTMVDEEKQESIQVPGCIPYLQRVYWALLDEEASQSAFALASMNALEEYTEERYRELTS